MILEELQTNKYFEELKTLEEKVQQFIKPEKQNQKYRQRLETAT